MSFDLELHLDGLCDPHDCPWCAHEADTTCGRCRDVHDVLVELDAAGECPRASLHDCGRCGDEWDVQADGPVCDQCADELAEAAA